MYTTESLVFDTPRLVRGIPLKMVAKRYAPDTAPPLPGEGLTLFFVHGTGTRTCPGSVYMQDTERPLYGPDKEHWEPIIEQLFAFQRSSSGVKPIREAWAADCPTHGDSAVLNAELLKGPERECLSCAYDLYAYSAWES